MGVFVYNYARETAYEINVDDEVEALFALLSVLPFAF